MSRPVERGAVGAASSNFGACAAACGDWRSAPARVCGAEIISTRAPRALPREGAGEAACPPSNGPAVEASSATGGSGNRRGPTLSETHSESSAQKITRARRLRALVLSVPEAICKMMTDVGKGMHVLGRNRYISEN